MKKILFTKSLMPERIDTVLDKGLNYDCQEVIKTSAVEVAPFDLEDYSLIFSSVNAVTHFFENGFTLDEDFTGNHYNKVYAVGIQTKRALRKYGYGTFKVLRTAKELSEFIIENSTKEKFIHFCGNLALNVLNKALPLQNIRYKKVVIYTTELLYPTINQEYSGICFFSPSGVRSFAKNNTFKDLAIFSIGHTTTNELLKHTQNKIITSNESNLEDLLQLINHWQKK